MIKKLLYIIVLLLLLVGSFVAGSWFSRQEPLKTNHSNLKSLAVNTAMKSDPYTGTGSSPLPLGTVSVSADKQQMIGIQLAPVEKAPWTHTLRVLGRVTLDETRVFRVAAAVDGWVRTAGSVVSGTIVQKDQVLATFYNRDFLTAQQTYLYALNTMDRFKDKESDEQLKLTRAQMRAAEENLEFLGMGETQIKEVARTRQIARNIELRAPVSGLVLVRNAFSGLRFDRGTELFRIAELNHIWVLADVFENEANSFRPGVMVNVRLPGGDKRFHARVSDTLPQFDAATRTLKIRLDVDNPGYALRPDMFVDVEFSIQLPPAITIPTDAVLDSGLKKTVFVDRGNGFFEPREVEAGRRMGNRVEIIRGLKPGERIVISGNFLIDSESRLEMAAAGMQETLSRDLVCGKDISSVKAEKAGRKIAYGGKAYYFDTDECKQQFEKDPKRYAVKPTEGDLLTPQAPPFQAPKKTHGHDHS
jgi:Cu(I)/Ag(I) efflux system membrane fusion protein